MDLEQEVVDRGFCMERVNGFLKLDGCRCKKSSYIGQYYVYIDGEEYYFKPTKSCYNEIVTYYILKFLGIDACSVDLATLNGRYGVISKSLRKEGVNLVSGNVILRSYLSNSLRFIEKMGFDNRYYRSLKLYYLNALSRPFKTINSLDIIWQALEYRYKDEINISEVMDQFVVMHLFDIIVNNVDRHEWNWMIEESDEGIRLAPLFDFDCCLKENYKVFEMGVNFDDLYYDGKIMDSARDRLANFLDVSSYDYLYLFLNMFNKVVNNFDIILSEVEEKIIRRIPVYVKKKMRDTLDKKSKQINELLDSDKFSRHIIKMRKQN